MEKTPVKRRNKEDSSGISSTPGTTSKLKRQKTISRISGPPVDWFEDYKLISEIRDALNAPVDTMGPSSLADCDAPAAVFEFQILVAAFLSSQTKDQRTKEGFVNLKNAASSDSGQHLSAEWVRDCVTEEELAEIIRPVGFYNMKAKNLKKLVVQLKEKHESRVPRDFTLLCDLPGIGPKMASLILSLAFGKTEEAVCVDTHVHRICGLLDWGCETCSNAKGCENPEHTRTAIESWLPKEYWLEFSGNITGLGQLLQQEKQKLRDWVDKEAKNPEETRKLLKKLGFK
jgi:endonuclease III